MESAPTIAAIATASGRGGVAVIRTSGPEAFAIAAKVTGREAVPGRIAFAAVRSPSTGALLDRCVVLAFRRPHSYTGEDVVEYQCHGGEVTPRRILGALFACGARLARRGEFTERAFLNGKMDLSEAESVIELVDAATDRAADDALGRLAGAKAREYRSLYDESLALSATLEHALDVDESDLGESFFEAVATRRRELGAKISAALEASRRGRILRKGALVVLAGRPNAGKSSLMNALLGDERAIVSPVAGTTRDSIEESLDLDGWAVRLVDTAGIRDSADEVEAEGVRRAETLIEAADLVVMLSPAGEKGPRGGEGEYPDPAPGEGKIVKVTSKCDLGIGGDGIRLSAKTGEGIGELKREIARRIAAIAEGGESAPTPSERECSLLEGARARLAAAPGDDMVLLANAVRRSGESLGALIGESYGDDILDAVFSRFCVGK